MSKKAWLIGGAIVVVLLGGTFFIRNNADEKQSATGTDNKVITLQVAHTQNYAPYDFINEKGESDGYEVQVLKAVDKKLKDYEFEYTGTSDDDLLIGLESGKYDIGTKGAWYTAERAEKFIIPKEPIGASIIGFTIRTEDKDKYTDIDSFAKAGAKLVPISPQNAQYNVISDYNKEHEHQQIALTEAESFNVADAYAWVLEGRYDAYFDIKLSFEGAVKDEKGAYHNYTDKLSWFAYKGIPTYPLIHKNDTNTEFVEAYEEAIADLKADGTLAKLSEQYFGEDVFEQVTD